MKMKLTYQQPISIVVSQGAAVRLLSGSIESPEYYNKPTSGFMSNPDVGEYGE